MTSLSITEDDVKGLKDKRVVVTGGSSGIGLGFVKLVSDLGGHVVSGDLNAPTETLPNVRHVKTDVGSWKSLQNLFQVALKELGGVDIVFANAGVGNLDDYLRQYPHEDLSDLKEPSHKNIKINLLACINTVILGLHCLRQQRTGGAIVVTASASSYQRLASPDYTIGKHGVLGLMRSLTVGLRPKEGIRINAIAPSWTDTGLLPKEEVSSLGVAIQSPRVVALSVALLALESGRHGHTIYSANGRYRELEEPILKFTEEAMGEEVSEGAVVDKLLAARETEGA